MGRGKRLSSLNSLVSCASQLSGAGSCIFILTPILPPPICREWWQLYCRHCSLGGPLGSEIHIWRAGILIGSDVVYRYGRRYSISRRGGMGVWRSRGDLTAGAGDKGNGV